MNQGGRADGDKATALFDEAVEAYRSALEVYAKADQPGSWAWTQARLGYVLVAEGIAPAGTRQFLCSIRRWRHTECARGLHQTGQPKDWAITQANLGVALTAEGRTRQRRQGACSVQLSPLTAYQNALEVDTRASLPQGWARLQLCPGSVLLERPNTPTEPQPMHSSISLTGLPECA